MKKTFIVLMMIVMVGISAQTITGSVNKVVGNSYKQEVNLFIPKIKDYCNVSSKDLEKLDIMVKGLLAQGWVPFGSVTAVLINGNDLSSPLYIQTMVKY